MIAPDGRLRLANVFNFRDLGGAPTIDGRTVARGIVFRSDGLHQADDADIERLRTIGLRTIIDLRTASEQEKWGIAPHDALGAELLHLPLLDELWPLDDVDHATDPIAFLVERYTEMAPLADRVVPLLIRLIGGEAHRVPVVFHCAAGKDRTGVTAALLLALAGVPRQHILEDYARTGPAMVELLAWVRARNPTDENGMVSHPPAFIRCPPEAMDGFLVAIEEQHGSIEKYVRSLGLDDVDLDAYRRAILV